MVSTVVTQPSSVTAHCCYYVDNAKTKVKVDHKRVQDATTGITTYSQFVYYYHHSLIVGFSPYPGVQVPESQQYQPEELNKKALAITDRVKQKLTGQSYPSS